MFRIIESSRQSFHPTLKCFRPKQDIRSLSRSGWALTEVLLIVLVPCFCLFVYALFDSDFEKALLSGPNKVDIFLVNPVFEAINMEDDKILTVHRQGQLRLWDLKKSVMLGEIQSQLNEVRCAAYSKSQRLIVVGSALGMLEIWDLEHPESPVFTGASSYRGIAVCKFTADGSVLLTAGEDGKVAIWYPRTMARVGTLVSVDTQDTILSLDVSSDRKYVAAGTQSGVVQIWDMEHRKLIHSHQVSAKKQLPDPVVETVKFLADNRSFICATNNDGIAIWNIETGVCVQAFEKCFDNLRSGTLSQDGIHFIAGSEHGRVVSWNLETGTRTDIPIPNTTIVRSIACSSDGKMLLIGDWNGQVQFQHLSNSEVDSEIAQR